MSLSKVIPATKKSIVVAKATAEKKPSAKKTSTAKPSSKPAPAKSAAAKPLATKPIAGTPIAKTKTKPLSESATKGNGASPITPEQRYRMICDAAYFRAERRGFIGGNSAEDWTAAEVEIDGLLLSLKH